MKQEDSMTKGFKVAFGAGCGVIALIIFMMVVCGALSILGTA